MLFRASLILLFLSFSFSQVRIGDWDALTCPLNIHDMVFSNDTVYFVTSGGLLVRTDDKFTTLTTIDGIIGVDIAAIADDSNGHLWLGGNTPNGFVQIYDPIKKISVNIFDFGLTQVTAFWIGDSLAFAAFIQGQDVGLMKWIYIDDEWSYRDIFRNFPISIGNINAFSVQGSKIFLGTGNGLWMGDISENLKDPANWSMPFPELDGNVSAIAFLESSATLSHEGILYIFHYDDLSLINQQTMTTPINFEYLAFDSKNYLWGIKGKKLYRKKTALEVLSHRYDLRSIAFGNEGRISVGSIMGLVNVDTVSWVLGSEIPNAPRTGQFSAITIMKDGRLVGASAWGLSVLEDQGWRNILEILRENSHVIHSSYDYNTFVADTIEYDFGGFVADIEEGPDGKVYCSIRGVYPEKFNPYKRGGGVLIIDIDNPEDVTVIDTTVLGYFTTQSVSDPYMVVKDVEFDVEGNLWVVNPYVINKNVPIHVRNPEGEWWSYGSGETSVKISQSPNGITFDRWNRAWVCAFMAEEANLGIYPNGGLFMLYYNGTPVDPINFNWSKIISGETVWSVAMGKNDRLYYLTPTGLNYFDVQSDANNPVLRENLYPYFPNLSFGEGAELKVDPHGNIWSHSPSQGVHILLENTTSWPDINGLRASNSPLLSDEITDIAFDAEKSLAYIATSKGVNILRIPFGTAVANYNNIKIFPSPFRIPANKPMVVSGLLKNSSMKIMTLDGHVVRNIPSQGISTDGDQLLWDGKDNNGIYVTSGVYLLAIYGASNNTFSKVTVIRE